MTPMRAPTTCEKRRRRGERAACLLVLLSLELACGGSNATTQGRDGSSGERGAGGSGASGGAGDHDGGPEAGAGGESGSGGTAGATVVGPDAGPDAGSPVYSCLPPSGPDAGSGDAGSGDVYATAGEPCHALGALACAGPNQQQTLVCDQEIWRALTTCPANQRCDPNGGICGDVVESCVGHAPGYSICDQDQLVTCGPNLVTVTSVSCCGVCVAGACVAPRCGDGKIEGTESCDDGNLTPGDGCEPDCQPTKVLQLAAGRAHTCALLTGGRVRCWGANAEGQLGLGTTADLGGQQPYQNGLVSLGGPAAFIAAGADHTCALMAGGSLRCWGANGHGQLGLGSTNALGDDELPSASPPINLGLGVTTVAAGGNCTCAILTDSTLRCWGQNNYGQLGLGNTDDVGDDELPSRAAAEVSLGASAALVTTGGNFSCAILGDGHRGRCWGQNGLGQLGLGITQNIGDDELPNAVAPFVFPSDSADPSSWVVTSIVSGESRTCALLGGQGINYCWGDNTDGGLGVGVPGADPLLKAVGTVGPFAWDEPARRIAAGGFHMCIELSNSELRCWGENEEGQLGLPNTLTLGDNESVVQVAAIDLGVGADGFSSYAVSMTGGAAHTCVILADGRVLCWGANESGQLGLGYWSLPPTDYVGGTPDTVPARLDAVKVFSP